MVKHLFLNAAIFVLSLYLSLTIRYVDVANAGATSLNLVYAIESSASTSQIRWVSLESDSVYKSIDISEKLAYYALPRIGKHVALATQDGAIYILDVASSSLRSLPTKLIDVRDQGLLYDHYYITSRSMVWAPDGQTLAFVGRIGAGSAGIYLYDVRSNALITLAGTSKTVDNSIEVSSWSPDGNWLAFVSAESGNDFKVGIASRNGKIITYMIPQQPLCRLSWSPSNEFLAADTRCFNQSNQTSNLVILGFSSSTNKISPIKTLSQKEGTVFPRYGIPVWRDNQTLAVPRTIGFFDFVSLLGSFRTEPVIYNVATDKEEVRGNIVLPDDLPFMQGDWGFWYVPTPDQKLGVRAYNFATGQVLGQLPAVDSCSPISVRVDGKGQYIAFLNGCSVLAKETTIRVINIEDSTQILSINVPPHEAMELLGFID